MLSQRNTSFLRPHLSSPVPLPPKTLTLTTTFTTTPQERRLETILAKAILDSTPETLAQTLQNPQFQYTPDLVEKTLKRLWNHAPKALQFFTHLLHHHSQAFSSSSFDHAVDIAARVRDYKTVWSLVARMRSLRLGPTPKTFSIITERYVSSGKPDRAIKVFLSMHQHGCVQDLNCFNTMLDILCKSRGVEMAYNKLFRVFRGKFKADCVSYNIIVNGWCLLKRTPKALEVMKEMVERGIKPNLNTYNIMLKGFFRARQINEAWEFFLEMKRRKCDIDVVTYTTVVHGLGLVGEVKRARKVFDEMIREGVLPSVVTYNALIQVLCKKDSVENAFSVFEEMLRKGYVPSSMTYNSLIRGFCHAKQIDRAMDLMTRMKDDGCDPNVQTYNIMIRYLCDAGEIEKGLLLFEKMGIGECLPSLDTYNILISAMFVRKRSDDLIMAGKLLIEMVDRGFLPRRFTFNKVLNGLLLTGNQEFAREILRMHSNDGHLPRHFKL